MSVTADLYKNKRHKIWNMATTHLSLPTTVYQISHNTRPFYSPSYFYYLVTHPVTHITFKKLYNFVRSFFNKYFTIPNMYILDPTSDINTVIDLTIPNVCVPKKWTFHKNLQLLCSSSLLFSQVYSAEVNGNVHEISEQSATY